MGVRVKIARSFGDKFKGLLGKKKAEPLLIYTRFGIHTFGLSFPIDVVILDKENRIKHIKKKLRRNRVFFWNPAFDKVLELPIGFIQKNGLKIGEKLILIYK